MLNPEPTDVTSTTTDAVEYYRTCNLIGNIHIVWSEKKPPSARLVESFSMYKKPKIVFDVHPIDSLNNRFMPLNGSHTEAIFAVDDDMRVSCGDLNVAYETWRSSKRSLVGFMPRTYLRRDNKFIYRCWWTVWWHGSYSIILTKAAIFHHDFMQIYTHKMPPEVRKFVDDMGQCEDIAMQFLIANQTHLPPIYVKGHLVDKGSLNGISTKVNIANAGHMKERSECLNQLVALFKGNPLKRSHIVVEATTNSLFAAEPSTWMEYISSDLWNFF